MKEIASHAIKEGYLDKPNPFSAEMSGYGVFDGKSLVAAYPPGAPMYDFHQKAHTYFRELVLGENFPCVVGQSVVRSRNYAFCAYEDMTSPKVAEGVCHDLMKFKDDFSVPFLESFMTAFKGPVIQSQLQGTEFLYTLLQTMHEADKKHGFPWANGYTSDIHSPNFAYSIGGEAHFISFFYPFASSETRQSEITMVLFNTHSIFQTLRQRGAFDKLKVIIRARIPNLHPHLGDHGDVNEFMQYALIDPSPNMQVLDQEIQKKVFGACPFHKEKS